MIRTRAFSDSVYTIVVPFFARFFAETTVSATPAAFTLNVLLVSRAARNTGAIVSSTSAGGVSGAGFTVIETVATFDSAVPSLAL